MPATCRFCLAEESKKWMIDPCACKGTSRWIHPECLIEWVQRGRASREVCPTCKTRYVYRTKMNHRERRKRSRSIRKLRQARIVLAGDEEEEDEVWDEFGDRIAFPFEAEWQRFVEEVRRSLDDMVRRINLPDEAEIRAVDARWGWIFTLAEYLLYAVMSYIFYIYFERHLIECRELETMYR